MTGMKKNLITALSTFLVAGSLMSVNAHAESDLPMYFDFGDTVINMNAGSEHTMHMRSKFNYTYHLGPHTSAGTYLECSFKSGTQDVIFHVGADEQAKDVPFYFYIDDAKVQSDGTYDEVLVRVGNAAQVSESVQVELAKKATGTVKKNGNVAMLYNDKDVAMASFSLTNGNGQMATLSLKGVSVNEGSKYFDVVSATDSTPVISESDKAVMAANGFAGVCVNGKYKNW
ncbi:hypothetical protein [Butyrivibrio sp. AE3003]|uniref:hypothetical protein n=1 Tax=Butyrivibrio sp. AE3003 TaxID=1496721 RepID=UPI0004797A17|nr:hypothetical protein [Butyrivibrio sp. AE3003]